MFTSKKGFFWDVNLFLDSGDSIGIVFDFYPHINYYQMGASWLMYGHFYRPVGDAMRPMIESTRGEMSAEYEFLSAGDY